MAEVSTYELLKVKNALIAYGRPEKFRMKIADVLKEKRQAEVDKKVAEAMDVAEAARVGAARAGAAAADASRGGGLFGFF